DQREDRSQFQLTSQSRSQLQLRMAQWRLSSEPNQCVAWKFHVGNDRTSEGPDLELHLHAVSVASKRSAIRIPGEFSSDLGTVGSHRSGKTEGPRVFPFAGWAGVSDCIRACTSRTHHRTNERKQLLLSDQLRSTRKQDSADELCRYDQLDKR